MRWTSPTGSVHETCPAGGESHSHVSEHTELPVPSAVNPAVFDYPPGVEAFPDPWDGSDWRDIPDPMTNEEFEHLVEMTRRTRPPPDLDARPEMQTIYACTCPAPF